MKYKEKIKRIIYSSAFLFGVVLALSLLDSSFNLNLAYRYDFTEGLTQTLFFFPLIVFMFSSILFFLREQVFLSWWNFAKKYLVVVGILIAYAISADSGGGNWGVSFGMNDAESTIWFFAGLFFFISIILIIYKSLKLRGK